MSASSAVLWDYEVLTDQSVLLHVQLYLTLTVKKRIT